MRAPASQISPLVGRVEPADGVEQGRLAAARGRRETHESALGDLEIDVVEPDDLDVALVVGLAQIDTLHAVLVAVHGHTFVMARMGSYWEARQAGERLAKKPRTMTMTLAMTMSLR